MEYKECCLLGFAIMQSIRSVLMFQKILLPASSEWVSHLLLFHNLHSHM